jgi:hypothetical protein
MPYDEPVFKLGIPIAPTEPDDVNPTHIAEYGRGGLMAVATTTARDAIPAARKTVGMLVYVSAESKYYTLSALPSTWTELATGGAVPDPLTIVELNTEKIDFDTTPADPATATGRMVWSEDYKTVMLGMNGAVVPIGQSMMKLAHNSTGSTIPKGKVVYISGSHANTSLLIDLADADLENASSRTIGVTAEDIEQGADGFIITEGLLAGLDTNSLSGAAGTAIWLSDIAGEFTSTKPTAPKHGVFLGWLVKKAGGAGSIFVKIINYPELDELHDVLITSVSNNDALIWDSTVWKNKKIPLASLDTINSGRLVGRRGTLSGTPEEISIGEGLKLTNTGILQTDITASDIQSGLIDSSLLGTGIASSATFLRGDNTWAYPSLERTSNALSGDVTMTNIDTWYDGPTVTIGAGTWSIDSSVYVQKAASSGVTSIAFRISDGTTTYASANQSWNSIASTHCQSCLSAIVTVGSSTTVKVQVAAALASCIIRAATQYMGSGNTASNINAVRIA